MFYAFVGSAAFVMIAAGLALCASAYDQYTVTRHQMVTGMRAKRRGPAVRR